MKASTMKTNRMLHKMKKAITFGVIALALVSCGKSSENEIIADTSSTGSNPVLVGSGGSDLSSYWANLKSQHSCSNYGGRMDDIVYTLNGSASGQQVYGSMVPGSTSGQVTQTYTGRNYGTNDLMFISQILNNGQIYYNVVISFCRYIDSYGQEFISENAGLSNFQAIFTLANSTNCPTGQIENGWIQFSSNLVSYDARQFTTINTSCY